MDIHSPSALHPVAALSPAVCLAVTCRHQSAASQQASLQVQTQLANHIAAIGPAILIGALCGLLAIAFTAINLRMARLRQKLLQVRVNSALCSSSFVCRPCCDCVPVSATLLSLHTRTTAARLCLYLCLCLPASQDLFQPPSAADRRQAPLSLGQATQTLTSRLVLAGAQGLAHCRALHPGRAVCHAGDAAAPGLPLHAHALRDRARRDAAALPSRRKRPHEVRPESECPCLLSPFKQLHG